MLNLELLANRRARRNRNNAIRAGQMGTAMNPGVASALPDTLTMRVGENLGQYFGALRDLAFPDFNKYLSATGDFLMEPSEQMASQMARGEPNVPFNRLPNTPNINPALVDTIGLLPVATVAKAPSTLAVPGLLGVNKIIQKTIENIKTPQDVFSGLYADARKAPSFEDFKKDYTQQIKHGKYYHITEDPNFRIDPEKGASDTMSYSTSKPKKGSLMVTSDLPYWAAGYGDSRKYVAEIDMSDVPRNQYEQVNRGQGNEFFIENASKAKVKRVVPLDEAIEEADAYNKQIPQSEEELREFYNAAKMQGLLGRTAQAETPSVVRGLLTASIGQKPEMQSLIFTGERSGLADSDRTIREQFLKAQMMSEETPSKYRDEQIFKETGLERGADGLFRLEISDDTAKVSLPDYMTGEQIQSKLDEYNARLKELSKEMEQYKKPSSYRQFNDPKGVELANQYDEILTQRSQLPQRPEIETTLGEVLDHPTLYKAYPELAEYKLRILPEGAKGGFFDQQNKTIEISGRDKEFLESSLLHEVQHGVQRLEDFAIGGNPDASSFLEIEAAKAQVREARNRFEKNTKQASYDFRTNRDAAKVRLNLLDQINDIVRYENIPAPRFLFNTGEWYKYSDEISRELGKMPSRNPKKRQWIEQAGQMIANRKHIDLINNSEVRRSFNYSDDELLKQINYYRRNRKELKNALRRAEYGYKKYFMSDAGRAYTDAVRAESKVNELKRLDSIKQEDRSGKDFERYQKLGGEVEARNVERRRKMTPEERQQTRGLLTEDVPRDEQILLRPSVYAEGKKTSSVF